MKVKWREVRQHDRDRSPSAEPRQALGQKGLITGLIGKGRVESRSLAPRPTVTILATETHAYEDQSYVLDAVSQ